MNAHSPEFDADAAEEALKAFDRRTFLKIMGAGFAAAGISQLGGCSKPQPAEKIVPYVRSPEYVIPGLPAYYASAMPTRGFASGFGRGVIVESHEGRPTKIEGNPLHPSSLGATDIFMQAAVLQLYDPARSKTPLYKNQAIGWSDLFANVGTFIAARGGAEHVRIAVLTNTLTSPTLGAQLKQLAGIFPNLRWFVDDPLGGANGRAGQVLAFGRRVTPVYDFTRAKRIVSLDAHFLAEEPGSVRYARDFSSNRGFRGGAAGSEEISRLYVAECSSTFTGAAADHRLAVTPSMIPQIADGLLAHLLDRPPRNSLPQNIFAWVNAVADDLTSHREKTLVIAGEYQLPPVHAAVNAMNSLLGAVGHTVDYLEPVGLLPAGDHSLAGLTDALRNDEVDLLLMLDVNPVYTAPADLAFGEVLAKFSQDANRLALHGGGYADETAQHCGYHLALSHPLESWSDLRAHDGTASIVQPLIEPLWTTRSACEILSSLNVVGLIQSQRSSRGTMTDYELVRDHWFTQWQNIASEDPQIQWRRSLRDGVIAGTQANRASGLSEIDAVKIVDALHAIRGTSVEAIELVFRPDPTIADGFYANHPWLQELPKPLTRVTWGNVALLGPATAARLGIERLVDPSRKEIPLVHIESGGQVVELPAWIQPGHPENTITLHLGGGRTFPEDAVQQDAGVDVAPLRQIADPWTTSVAISQIRAIGQKQIVACVQAMEFTDGRDIFRSREVGSVSRGLNPPKNTHLSLYQEYSYPGYKWGMVVDLSTCIGCNACVIACQAENNIPCVGKEQVYRGREMHWIRIDTYFGSTGASSLETAGAAPQAHFLPMLCQHCENAPCELVCPVEATSHSDEGINEMTYNRCIGTRYCSNNCPYKVRRFNFLHYTGEVSADESGNLESMQKNPNVTVRSRGVMEKCTYCIQRINRARIDAKREWEKNVSSPEIYPVPEMRKSVGDDKAETLPRLSVTTACQQSCPTQAIVFGDLNDAEAQVTKLKTSAAGQLLNYSILEELNTQPRTTYLEKIINSNPALVSEGGVA